jgi:hypothetical protein
VHPWPIPPDATIGADTAAVRPKKAGGVMRLHGLLVYALFIGFLVAIIPSPSHAQPHHLSSEGDAEGADIL